MISRQRYLEREAIIGLYRWENHHVCTDNPYAVVWQPAEGTCEQFAAAGGN